MISLFCRQIELLLSLPPRAMNSVGLNQCQKIKSQLVYWPLNGRVSDKGCTVF